jgi:DNA-binding IclR family transcriptional regulator
MYLDGGTAVIDLYGISSPHVVKVITMLEEAGLTSRWPEEKVRLGAMVLATARQLSRGSTLVQLPDGNATT